jgi:uncharacterized membrane protein
MKKLGKYFVNGLLFLIPVGVTVYIVLFLFNTIDETVKSIFVRGQEGVEPQWWWTGLGVIILLVVITLVGFLSSLFITRPLLQLIEKMLCRLPLVKLLYSSLKDLVGAFVGEQKKFDQPVIVNVLPGGNAKALGFITRKSMDFLGLDKSVAVYFPQSYNFAGSVLIFPADQVQPIQADSSDVMAFIVSGGVSGVKQLHIPQEQNKHKC